MAGSFYIITMTITTDTSVTSGIQLLDRPAIWSLEIPTMAIWCKTATCNVRLEGSTDGTVFRPIGYSNNPATATSGFKNWEAAADQPSQFVICEAAQFPPYIRVSVTQTSTASAEFRLVGKLI